jgi:hypothetical protein
VANLKGDPLPVGKMGLTIVVAVRHKI